jgi:anti-sigma B factor antagonist
MEYQVDRRGDVFVLKLSGDITIYQLQDFKEAIETLKEKRGTIKNVIIDLGGVGYFDSLALGALCAFSKEVREKGGDLKLLNMNKDVRIVFDLAHLSKVYQIYDNIEAAEKSFL